MPASPTTSGCAPVLPASTGAPHAIASNNGNPKPSLSEGETKAVQAL
jgi:hypothetical protein